MTIAKCIYCGTLKFGAMSVCKSCDQGPADERAMASSLALSDHHFEVEELQQISDEIGKTGKRPVLPVEQEQEFVRAVGEDRNMRVVRQFNAANNEAASAKRALPPADFEAISRLPLFVFVSVAGADGKIDKKEMSAFSELLLAPGCMRTFKSPLFRALILFGDNSLEGINRERFAVNYSTKVAGIVSRWCLGRDFELFAGDVRSLALIIANASGGFFGFGNKISNVEREMIAGLSEAFSGRSAEGSFKN